MPRPKLERPIYRLTKRPGKRKWYVTWTDPNGAGSKYTSTGIEVQEPDNKDESPSLEAQAHLAQFATVQNAPAPGAPIGVIMDKRFAAWKAMRPRSKAAISVMKSYHKMVKGFFGMMQPGEIVPQTLIDYETHRTLNTKRHGGGKPITAITRELEEIRSALLFAKANKWPGYEVVPKLTFPAKRPPRHVIVTRAQGKKLVTAAGKTAHLKLFILIALSTGQRRGAILDLTWDRVDLKRGILDFRNPEEQENNKQRGVCAVDRRLVAALSRARKMRRTDHVIEFRAAKILDVKKAFAEAATRAGLTRKRKNGDATPWVTPHVLKHSVISWLCEEGEPVEHISDFTATDIATVRRIYKMVNPDYHSSLRDSLGGAVFGPVRVRKGSVSPTPGRKNKSAEKR